MHTHTDRQTDRYTGIMRSGGLWSGGEATQLLDIHDVCFIHLNRKGELLYPVEARRQNL